METENLYLKTQVILVRNALVIIPGKKVYEHPILKIQGYESRISLIEDLEIEQSALDALKSIKVGGFNEIGSLFSDKTIFGWLGDGIVIVPLNIKGLLVNFTSDLEPLDKCVVDKIEIDSQLTERINKTLDSYEANQLQPGERVEYS